MSATHRRMRYWALLAVVLVVGAVLVGALSGNPARELDPASTDPSGSRALAQVLRGYGTDVVASSSAVPVTAQAVLVTDPGAYSAVQLAALVGSAQRVVLVAPDIRALRAAGLPGVEPDSARVPSDEPGCSDPGARAAGAVTPPSGAVAYDGLPTSCYGGVVGLSGHVVVLGSAALLRNDTLAADGVAALDVNLITANRTLTSVRWLLPGSDAAGSGALSIWDLFPPGVYRVFAWSLLVGVLVVVWRARRLGGVVSEPLPVVVRSAEAVEGHGRLYRRAGARDRAADALRAATLARLRSGLALHRGADAVEVAAVAGVDPRRLTGAPPADDAALVRLATDLDDLEEHVERTRRG